MMISDYLCTFRRVSSGRVDILTSDSTAKFQPMNLRIKNKSQVRKSEMDRSSKFILKLNASLASLNSVQTVIIPSVLVSKS